VSRAAVSAKKAEARVQRKVAANEAFFAMAEHSSRVEASVVRCESCNLLQVTGHRFRLHEDGKVHFDHPGPCFMCGHEVGWSA
jgi:hypothetical protein